MRTQTGNYVDSTRRARRRGPRLSPWNCVVLAIGYLTLLYAAARGVMYLLVLFK